MLEVLQVPRDFGMRDLATSLLVLRQMMEMWKEQSISISCFSL